VKQWVHAGTLDLGQCDLGCDLAAAVLRNLPKATRKCRLFGNPAVGGAVDVSVLLDVSCPHLVDLDLGGCELSQE